MVAFLCVIDEDLEDQIKEKAGKVVVGTGKVVVGAAAKTAKFALDSVGTIVNAINPFK